VKLLSILHRWTGGFIGLLLAILGLTGAILVWESDWISLPHASDPLVENVATMAAVVERAGESGKLARVTFAGPTLGLHQIAYAKGAGAYAAQDGTIVERWSSQWQRPELWLFDLHHHLLAGEMGETITGIAGIAGLLFVITGTILWWRSRRSFRFRPWPRAFKPGAVVSHHRDIGIVAAPLLLISFVTGVLMLFPSVRDALVGKEARPRIELSEPGPGRVSVEFMLAAAKQHFSRAELRRISFPRKPGDPISVRVRQPSEWTPNGRTQLSFDSRTGALLSIEDAAAGNGAAQFTEKLYPLHTATVGGLGYKLLVTISGLALTLLGSLAVWSFWVRKAGKRTRARKLKPAESAAG
jgi:uncharacterized iron-regulated membrane protein